jgi:hypothetical protein
MNDVTQPVFDPHKFRAYMREAEKAYAKALGKGPGARREAAIMLYCAEQACERGNVEPFRHAMQWSGGGRIPVTIREFIESPEFIGARMDVWPAIKDDLDIIFPDVFVGKLPVYEANLGGAEGIGKSFIIQIAILYTAYLYTCYRDPQPLFGLSSGTQLQIPLMAATTRRADDLLYRPLRQTFEAMPWSQRLRYNKDKKSALEIEQANIKIYTGPPAVETFIGGASPAAGLDEVNIWAVVSGSARANGGTGTFDQAETVYKVLARRRAGRFTTQGFNLGCLLISSQIQYADDFLERRMAQAANTPGIKSFKHATYDVTPAWKYSGDKMRVLVGTDRWPTQVLEEGTPVPEGGDVREVPIEFERYFRDDPEGACRSYIGVAVGAISPFIAQRHKLQQAFDRGIVAGLNAKPWVAKPVVLLEREGMPVVLPENLPEPELRQRPHFVHVDISETGDRTGIAFARFEGTAVIKKGMGSADTASDTGDLVQPRWSIPLAVGIKPSKLCPIDQAEIVAWIAQFATVHGINIIHITFDGHESVMAQQTLRKAGFRSFEISVDRTMAAYESLRRAIYEDRVDLPSFDALSLELTQLETKRLKTTMKVDHPARGGKDIADAIAGAIHGGTQSPQVRFGASFIADDEGQRLRNRRAGGVRPTRERPVGRIRR